MVMPPFLLFLRFNTAYALNCLIIFLQIISPKAVDNTCGKCYFMDSDVSTLFC